MKTYNTIAEIPESKKHEHLLSLSEDEFRDQLLRPLLLKLGLEDGRDYCGRDEYGKDCLFVSRDAMGINVYTIQTKKGNINMSRKATENLLEAAAQIRMMLEVEIPLIEQKRKVLPNKVFLYVSGKINERAREEIVDRLQRDPRIEFRDSDDIIPLIDKHLPEFWYGVEANKSPYLSSLLERLTGNSKNSPNEQNIFQVPIGDDSLIQLYAYRMELKKKKVRGQYHPQEVTEPEYKEIPIEDLLTVNSNRILLIAEAGDGKTTSLHRLTAKIASESLENIQNANIPIFVRCVDLAKEDTSLVDYVASHTSQISHISDAAFDYKDLQEGKVTLLVDALDEISDQDEREELVQKVIDFSLSYPNCKIILTTRNYIWIDKISSLTFFRRYRLSTLDWRQTESLVKQSFRNRGLAGEQATEILRRLQEVHGMDLNPFMVKVFLASSEAQRSDIPANITELFKKFTEQMLGRWDESKGLSQQIQAPIKDFVLKRVALRMHKERTTQISLTRLTDLLNSELKQRGQEADIDQLVHEIVHRSGLFSIIGDTVEFRHLLVQEFFAGRGLSAEEIHGLIEESWWQRCIIFYFGENPDNLKGFEDLLTTLRNQPQSKLLQSVITLGLALQACYLLTLDEKAILYADIVELLGHAAYALFDDQSNMDLPLTRFISEYIFARDSTSCDVLQKKTSEVRELVRNLSDCEENEYIEFWYTVGLVERGLLDEAEIVIKESQIQDPRMYLSIYLGLMLYKHTRVTSSDKKKAAQKLMEKIAPRALVLLPNLLQEFNSQILEVRRGEITALPDPRDTDELEDDGASFD